MIVNRIKILSIVFCIILSIHWFIFFSWAQFFSIQIFSARISLFLILFFLPVTFIFASILIHISNNFVTRACYIISGLWLGLMSFLVFISAIVWIVKGLLWCIPFCHARSEIIISSLAFVLYGLAVMYTGFCHYKFYKIKIKNLSIPVKNLPEQWLGKKIIHLSDLHLGGAKDLGFLKKLVVLVNDINADLILITGDLFDGAGNSQERYMPYLNRFKAGKGVIFTSGNHEIYSGVEKSRALIKDSKIRMLDNKAVIIDGMQILGISYPEFKDTCSFDFDNPKIFNKNMATILLYHTPTDIKPKGKNLHDVRSSDYIAPDIGFSTAMNNGIGLQLSGHTHAGQFFPFTWIADKVFKGFHYGLHQIGDFYINISSGTGSWGPPLRSGYLSEIVVISLVRK